MTGTLLKMCVFWDNMHPEIEEMRRRCEKLYAKHCEELVITSARDSTHGIGSYHPSGRAFDIRPGSVVIAELKAIAPNGMDIIKEKTHYHIEYDPK